MELNSEKPQTFSIEVTQKFSPEDGGTVLLRNVSTATILIQKNTSRARVKVFYNLDSKK
jgi:hypothetical protein